MSDPSISKPLARPKGLGIEIFPISFFDSGI